MKLKASTYNQFQPLCWTEDNRLQAVQDNNIGSYYNYDASGERNLKLTGAVVHMSQNGVPYDYVILESPTLYASGLITINERGYTKHYFEENKRVCSNIGGGFRDAGYDITEPIGLITSFEEQLGNAKDGIFKTFDQCIKSPVDLENTKDKIVNVMKDHEKDRNEEEYQFYYTNDHLGSSTYITNKEGQITQTLAYLPYGEDWVDLDNQPPYLTPYKFNGKEKDQETGYQYFGARYLNPKLSIWLSVDPMSDKYPNESNYVYCSNNPVKYIDPNGKEKLNWISKTSKEDAPLSRAVDKLKPDGAIHIYSHGGKGGMNAVVNGKLYKIRNPQQLVELLNKHSETWKNREEGDDLTIVLHACKTGQGENSFAEKLSKSKEFKDVNIIAPTEKDWFGDDGEVGTYKPIPTMDEKGNNKKNGGKRSDVEGNWITFKNGEKTDINKGNWKPKKVEE